MHNKYLANTNQVVYSEVYNKYPPIVQQYASSVAHVWGPPFFFGGGGNTLKIYFRFSIADEVGSKTLEICHVRSNNLGLNWFKCMLHPGQICVPEICISGSGMTLFSSVIFRHLYLLSVVSTDQFCSIICFD